LSVLRFIRLTQALAGAAIVIMAMNLGGCSRGTTEQGYSPRVVAFGQPVPKGGGQFKLGSPYVVAGVQYVPRHEPRYDRNGIASWYGEDFHGRLTANGEVYDMDALSAAHPTLPLPSMVRVTNLATGQTIDLRINDRGPFKPGRIIDLSRRAAHSLGILRQGTARVRVRYLGPAPL